jgi:hypothetical protein
MYWYFTNVIDLTFSSGASPPNLLDWLPFVYSAQLLSWHLSSSVLFSLDLSFWCGQVQAEKKTNERSIFCEVTYVKWLYFIAEDYDYKNESAYCHFIELIEGIKLRCMQYSLFTRKCHKTLCFFSPLRYWGLHSEPTLWASPPALFCDGFFSR